MQQVYKILMNMCITSYPFISSGLYRLPGLQINFISILQGSDPPQPTKFHPPFQNLFEIIMFFTEWLLLSSKHLCVLLT